MNLWLIVAIAVAAVVTAIVFLRILKSRLSDHDVWEELVDPSGTANDSASQASVLGEINVPRDSDSSVQEETPQLKVEPMTIPTATQMSRSFRGADLRRSSRLEQPVSLVVMGTNRRGESFQEKTSASSFNLHGCRYSSRHDYPSDGWVTLQVTGTDGMNAPAVRARVRSVLLPKGPREMSQVGVELETPANVWGVQELPEDWDRILHANGFSGRAAAATAPALTPPPAAPQLERKAEVTVFPSPAAPPEPAPAAAAPAKPDRLVLTPDQLLQALQGKLQLAADRAVQTAITTHLNDSVRVALAKIDDVWKSNVRQAEEFSNARLGETQNRWERELVVYRSRAEEVSRRLEALAAAAHQSVAESQKLSQQVKNEIEPQLGARINEALERAKSDFAANAAEVSGQHIAQVAETAQTAARDARAHFDESLAQIRTLASDAAATPATAPAGVSEERLEQAAQASRNEVWQQMEQRLSEIWTMFEQQQDMARQRTDHLAAALGDLSAQLQETKTGHDRAVAEIRSLVGANAGVSGTAELETRFQAAKDQLHNDFEWRLGEVGGKFEQLQAAARKNADGLADRLNALTAETHSLRAEHEQGFGDVRSALAKLPASISEERLDWLLNSTREQLLNHIESRIGEVASHSEQQHDVTRQHAEEIAKRVEALAANTRAQLDQARTLAENSSRSLRPGDLGALEEAVDRVTREFETAAVRVSDRQLVRLTEQKQALANEATLELEARASETRALLQKAANNMLDEFRRRVEVQIDLVTQESTERVASTLASLDAESRAACEARKRLLETEVARAAEQSTAEFRSGIKAFLYSCLVAAVSAVDQHAQTTMAGLDKNAMPGVPALENTGSSSPKPESRTAAANSSDSSK